MKALMSAVIIMMICFSPLTNNSQMTVNSSDTVISTSIIVMAGSEKISDENMILQPTLNCDPQMLIPVTPDNDPEFLIEPLS